MNKDFDKLYPYLEHLPVGASVFHVELVDGKAKDFTFEYANETFRRWTNKSMKELIDNSYTTLDHESDTDWIDITYKAACLGVNQHFVQYTNEVKKWLDIHVAQLAPGYAIVFYTDITSDQKAQELATMEDSDDLVLKCAKILHGDSNSNDAVNKVLSELGKKLHADRAYILETNMVTLNNTYEWCKEGIKPEIQNLQNVPYSVADNWNKQLETKNFIHYHNIHDLMGNSPVEHDILASQEIERLLALPLYDGKRLFGFVGVDNYEETMLFEGIKILQAVAFFLSSHLKQKMLIEQSEAMSYRDSLTNAFNRAAFSRLRKENYDLFKNVGVVYIDINGLKFVNDTYGHLEGDALITSMYKLLLQVFPEDTIYRMGGDEFVILEHNIEESEFRKQFKELHSIAKSIPLLEFASGSHYQSGETTLSNILKIADSNMYEDKKRFYVNTALKSGRYRPHLDDRFGFMDSIVFHRLLNNGQIIFYLQPKFDSKDLKLSSCEALVRYVRDNGEVVAAGEFISLLETTHYISELDYYVFKSVCIQIQKWIDSGIKPVRVAVNFSRNTLARVNFIDELLEHWTSCPVPKELLEIEITESAITENQDTLNETIASLRKNGFTVSMDDFGVEQANLATLAKMEFDYIKIDRSFVDVMLKHDKTIILISSLIKMCHDMGIKVVTEGVEREKQVKTLIEMGTDELQGFYFSEAISPSDFTRKYLKVK